MTVTEPVTAAAAAGPPVFSTDDPDTAHAYICRTYLPTRARPVGDQTGLRMRDEQHDLGPLGVENFSYTAGLEQLVPPVGRLMLARTVSGRWQRETIGDTQRMSTGDVCVLAQPDRPHLARWDTAVRLQIILLDSSALFEVASGPANMVPRFTGLVPAGARGHRLLVHAFDAVQDVVDRPAGRRSPLTVRRSASTLAAALLDAIPNTAEREPESGDRLDAARTRVLQAAVAYVHDHAHEDVGVRELAAATGVSRQAVHLAFRRHLDTTPRSYLERVRLDRVRRDLTDLDPAVTSVEQVARLWGFGRLERFRRYYAWTFGTAPEVTLRSRAGPPTRSAGRP